MKIFRLLRDEENSFISKDYTSQMKGVAILMMLFLHLFNNSSRYAGMVPLFEIDNTPLAVWLSQICTACVSMYLIMSGYGLWIVSKQGKGKGNFRRVALLYLRVFLIALLFFPLSYFFFGGGYTLDAKHFLLSVSGIQPYFNDEWWFLFPWAVICLLSPILFKILKRLGVCKTLLIACALDLFCSWYIRKEGNVLFSLPGRYFYQIILVIRLSFPFLIGAVAAKTGLFVKIQSMEAKGKLMLCFGMTLILLLRMFVISYGIFNPFMALGICCMVMTFKPNKFLIGMGKQSTNMWLVHTFFCYYYLHDFFQYLKYPILMFVVLILYSYVTACLIDYFYKKLKNVLVG